MADLDLAFLSATDMRAGVAAGTVAPSELVSTALRRIEEVNSQVNAFCFVWDDAAMAAAQRADQAVAAGETLGPLHGVPIALKDTTPTAGHTTTLGSYAFETWVPGHDALIAQSLQQAGAIIVGKTTTPEFAHSLATESPLWGITRNPWNLERSTGGSSGGAGAAVATGCVPLAEGSDMGGSVRIPAAWCGVVGLKPGLGRIPMDVLPGLFDTISHHGPLARNVADAQLFLDVAQGPDDADILSQPVPLDLGVGPVPDLAGVRVGLSVDLGRWHVESAVRSSVEQAALLLAERGAIVEPVDVGFHGDEEAAWNRLWDVFMAAYYGHLVADFGDQMTPDVLALIERGNDMGAVAYKQVEFVRTRMWNQLRPILAAHDVLLCPTMATGPVPASIAGVRVPGHMVGDRYHSPDMTAIWNMVSPCPAISVPCGLDLDGMPIGAQLIGQRWRSDQLLQVAAHMESLVAPIGRPPL